MSRDSKPHDATLNNFQSTKCRSAYSCSIFQGSIQPRKERNFGWRSLESSIKFSQLKIRTNPQAGYFLCPIRLAETEYLSTNSTVLRFEFVPQQHSGLSVNFVLRHYTLHVQLRNVDVDIGGIPGRSGAIAQRNYAKKQVPTCERVTLKI